MEFKDIIEPLGEGKELVNGQWNGLKLDKIMYVTLQKPDEHSMNTEPYFVFHSGVFRDGGWDFKVLPWTPSALDMLSDEWFIRVK